MTFKTMQLFLDKLLNKILENKNLRYLASYVLLVRSLKFPPELHFEVSSKCNLRCYMCPHSRDNNQKMQGDLDFDLFRKIIDESLNYGKREVIFLHKNGESLLNSNLFKMIHYLVSKRAARRIILNSNATLLSEENCNKLLSSGLDVFVASIDAVNPKTYFKMKRVDILPRVEENMYKLVSLKKRGNFRKPYIVAKFITLEENKEEREKFIQKWSAVVNKVVIEDSYNWPEHRIKKPKTPQPLEFCASPFNNLVINWDGSATLCCRDYTGKGIVGSARKEDISEIWKGARARAFRRALMKKNMNPPSLCKHCTNIAQTSSRWWIEEQLKRILIKNRLI